MLLEQIKQRPVREQRHEQRHRDGTARAAGNLSLAGVDERYAAINQAAQRRYLTGLVALLAAARPDLDPGEVERRANDILIVQNGVWLTSVLVPDPDTVARSVARTEAIAFDDGLDSAATRSA